MDTYGKRTQWEQPTQIENLDFFQNGNELTNDSDIPGTVHFFLEM